VVRLSSLLSIESGAPFDITTGSDLYGTTLFNSIGDSHRSG